MAITFLSNEDENRIVLERGKESLEQLASMLFQHEEQMASVRISANPNIHAEYFQITDDGVVSLKDVYRGAVDTPKGPNKEDESNAGVGNVGDLNAELPKHLIVPEIVDEKAVVSLSPAIFRYNHMLESVTLPNTISELPDYCFDNCWFLKNVYNTANIKRIGHAAFQRAGVVRLNFPNLEQFVYFTKPTADPQAPFINCNQMVYVDIGKVTSLPPSAFLCDFKLNMVKSEKPITSVAKKAFLETPRLKHINLSDLSVAKEGAFLRSGVDFDPTLDTTGFGNNATYLQYSPNDYWSNLKFTPCENPLPTFLSQNYKEWAGADIGTTKYKYSQGCAIFCMMHIYCAVHNLTFTHINEFLNYLKNEANLPNWINGHNPDPIAHEGRLEALGLTVDRRKEITEDSMQAVYTALSDGKYVMLQQAEPEMGGQHVVVIYGINKKGELLVADSAGTNYADGMRTAHKYTMPIYKLRAQQVDDDDYAIHIVSL